MTGNKQVKMLFYVNRYANCPSFRM